MHRVGVLRFLPRSDDGPRYSAVREPDHRFYVGWQRQQPVGQRDGDLERMAHALFRRQARVPVRGVRRGAGSRDDLPGSAPPPPPLHPTYMPPVYTPPTYTPPAYASPTSYSTAQTLGYNEALQVTRSWMSRKYGRRWSQGRHRIVRCPVRTSAAQRGCYAVWIYGGHVYSKTIVITERQTSYTITGNFSSAPTQAPSAPTSTDFCSTHVCIPNYPYGTGTTVQCADGTYSHSGGKQGACSYHGGVARASAARLSSRQADQLLAPTQRRLRLMRKADALLLSTGAR